MQHYLMAHQHTLDYSANIKKGMKWLGCSGPNTMSFVTLNPDNST